MSARLEPGERGAPTYRGTSTGYEASVYFRDHSGTRRRVRGYGSTRRAALKAADRRVEAALKAGGGGYSARTLFEVAVVDWLTMVKVAVDRGARSPSTYEQYERNAKKHVIPRLGAVRLSDLTTGTLDKFLADLHESTGYATAKVARTVLSGTCGMLMRRDALRHNPVRDVGAIEQGRVAQPRSLTLTEVTTLLEVLDSNPYAVRKDLPDLIRFMLATGVRIGEALGVLWGDVDLDRRVVKIEATVIRVRGVGLVRKNTKSAASDRALRLPDWCVEMLRRRKAGPPTAPVFPDSKGGFRDRSNVGRDLRTVRSGTTVAWFKSHAARRTVATILDGQGLSARVIADQLGHARPSMTQDKYMGRQIVGGATSPLDGLLSADPAGSPPGT